MSKKKNDKGIGGVRDEVREALFGTKACIRRAVRNADLREFMQKGESSAPQKQSTEDLAKQLGLRTAIGLEALKVALANVQTLDRKQQDYGAGNISAFGELGLLVRCNDKIERLKNLHKTGRLNDPENEATTDSWLDLSNYGLIAILVRTGVWK